MQGPVTVSCGWPAAESSGGIRRACLTINISLKSRQFDCLVRSLADDADLDGGSGDASMELIGSQPAGSCVG